MKTLYLILDFGTLALPILLSFDHKVHYFSRWKDSLIAAFIIAVPFLIWDILFTANGIWGFNDTYLTGIKLFHLPIEEILFFFVVPFACTFIYECLKTYFISYHSGFLNKLTILIMFIIMAFVMSSNPTGWYSVSVAVSSFLSLILLWQNRKFYFVGPAFLISLLPFLLVNGILTGSVTEEPVVWYNNNENINIRIGTIPLEDILYSFSLIVPNILLFEKIRSHRNEKNRTLI